MQRQIPEKFMNPILACERVFVGVARSLGATALRKLRGAPRSLRSWQFWTQFEVMCCDGKDAGSVDLTAEERQTNDRNHGWNKLEGSLLT